MNLFIALLHHPVYNKSGDVITTSITGVDLHDIARSALTFGVSRYYVVNPLPPQRKFAARIASLWKKGRSFEFNPTRAQAFELLKIVPGLQAAIKDIKDICGAPPYVVATSAKAKSGITFKDLSKRLKSAKRPYLIVFGTGWGMTEKLIDSMDLVLEPIRGVGDYRHLSVRSAVAIILDRLLGRERR